MDSEISNQTINKIIDAMNDNSLIVFVGAGVSADSGLPKWGEIIERMSSELSIDSKEENYLKIAQFYYDTFGKQEYLKKINDIFKENSRAQPNRIHTLINKMHPKHIITTNYDTLLEDKLDSNINKYDVISSDDDIPYSKSKHYLIKMHGDFKEKNIVFKEDDYLDYERNFPMISTLVKTLIMNNTILFLGYSLNDTTFNSIFRLIHTSFGENAKKAYFFTPKTPKEPVVEYYEKKGIYVLSDSEEITVDEYGKSTYEFLSKITDEIKKRANNQNQLWNKIKFLNKLSFVDSQDVANSTTLDGRTLLRYPDQYDWIYSEDEKNEPFKVSNDSDVIKFVKSKTMINSFLGIDIQEHYLSVNSLLKPAFELYQKHEYDESRIEFRKIANKAYKNQDYINFLIAEFNVEHININFFEGYPSEIETPVYGNESFSEVLDRIIGYSNEDDKLLALYLKENVFNFKFIYRKMNKINSLLSELRQEQYLYKNGGSSKNNNLYILKFEYQSFIQFIESNCLCVNQYKEFRETVDKYFESLILVLNNSKIPVDESTMLLGKTSSIINEISVYDIEKTIPYINYNMIKVYLDDYSLSKIKISDEAYDLVCNKIIGLIEETKKNNIHLSKYQLLNHYIEFLKVIDLKHLENVIKILQEYPIYPNNNSVEGVRNLLDILIHYQDDISTSDYEKLQTIIIKKINEIISNGIKSQYDNFYQMSYFLEIIGKKIGKESVIINSTFMEKLLYINTFTDKLNDIINYELLINSFYQYFDITEKKLVKEILNKYSEQNKQDINLYFVIDTILRKVYNFSELKSWILDSLISSINSQNSDKSIKSFPNKSDVDLAKLFNLYEVEYLSMDEISKININDDLKGIYPEVDWVWFKNHDDETIEKLVKKLGFKKAKEIFGKDGSDEKLFDHWGISHLENGLFKLI